MKKRRALSILGEFSSRRILIVGDVMLDEYIWGEVRRISPEAPVPVVESRRRTYVPGGAGNTSANVVSLGGRALLGGVIGEDHQAAHLIDALQRCGIEPEGLVVDPLRPTTTKTRVVAHHQQIVRVDSEQRGSLPAAAEMELLDWIDRRVAEVDACILSDYAKGVVSSRLAEQLIQKARKAGRPVVVDPKGSSSLPYRGATVVKPNLHEAERLVKRDIVGEAALLQAGHELAAQLEGSAVLLTRGAEGMSLFRDGELPVHIPSVAREVFDVTGAGDTVVSTLAMALGAGASLEEAAQLANCAAGIVVGHVGTTAVTLAELRGCFRAERPKPGRSRRSGVNGHAAKKSNPPGADKR